MYLRMLLLPLNPKMSVNTFTSTLSRGGKETCASLRVLTIAALYMLTVLPMLVTMCRPETLLVVFFPGLCATPLDGFSVIPFWVNILRQLAEIV